MSPPGQTKQHPLTPPLDRVDNQDLVSSNPASPSQPSSNIVENTHLPPSQISFSAQDSHQLLPHPYEQESNYQGLQRGDDDQATIQSQIRFPYDQYSDPRYHAVASIPYIYPDPHQLNYPLLSHFDSSPSTPASNQSNGRKRTRKTTRTTKANKSESDEETPRKAAKGKKKYPMDKSKIPQLTEPLSELTKDLEHIPIRDMLAWGNRSKEERDKDIGKVGRIPRPMNSFMLYRSAYSDRCKIWCAQNNHQVVSTVCGQSWALESPEIRRLYGEYAQIERDSHAKAYPDYRFTPAKATKKGRKRRKLSQVEEVEEEPSDLEDADLDYQPSAVKQGKSRARAPGPVSTFPVNLTPSREHRYYSNEGENGRERSTFQYSNPGKVAPLPLQQQDLTGQYFQSTTVSNAQGQDHVQDVIVRRTDAPGPQYGHHPPVVGLPGQKHYELLDGQLFESGNGPVAGAPLDLDPMLTQNNHYDNSSVGFVHDQNFVHGQVGYAFDDTLQSTGTLIEGHTDSDGHIWTVAQPKPGPSDGVQDFDLWWAEENVER